jgi:hypothetical protein
MKNLKYIFKTSDVLHVINAKVSQNKKIGIGYIIQTYHFSIEQVKDMALNNDAASCMDCPLSFNQNNGKSGGCYTHKGMQLMGLKSMLRSLNKKLDTIKDFDAFEFKTFIDKVKKGTPVNLIRFGAYGEPVLLPIEIVEVLASMSPKTTGYTHQWNKLKYHGYNKYFMSSTHTDEERNQSRALGFRSFFVATEDIKGAKPENATNCPASKESALNLSCIACGLCNGARRGNKKDIYILKH